MTKKIIVIPLRPRFVWDPAYIHIVPDKCIRTENRPINHPRLVLLVEFKKSISDINYILKARVIVILTSFCNSKNQCSNPIRLLFIIFLTKFQFTLFIRCRLKEKPAWYSAALCQEWHMSSFGTYAIWDKYVLIIIVELESE